jgi:hypothetical protein
VLYIRSTYEKAQRTAEKRQGQGGASEGPAAEGGLLGLRPRVKPSDQRRRRLSALEDQARDNTLFIGSALRVTKCPP